MSQTFASSVSIWITSDLRTATSICRCY